MYNFCYNKNGKKLKADNLAQTTLQLCALSYHAPQGASLSLLG
jgi:hypothetical protein